MRTVRPVPKDGFIERYTIYAHVQKTTDNEAGNKCGYDFTVRHTNLRFISSSLSLLNGTDAGGLNLGSGIAGGTDVLGRFR